MIVYVTNTQARLLHLPSEIKKNHDGGRDNVTVLYNGVAVAPTVKGVTEPAKVDKDYWDRISKKPTVRSWMRLGWLKVTEEGDTGVDMPESLTGYNIKTSTTLVEGETSRDLILQWQKTEHRPEVKHAIEAQLLKVKK